MTWLEKWAMIQVVGSFLAPTVLVIFLIVVVVKVWKEDNYK